MLIEYKIYGGTNWGNLGYHGGYTSYDYGAAISEDRHIWREKYAEMKLEANFLKVSPAYLTATPLVGANGSYGAPPTIAVGPLIGNGTQTNFYVIRHADFTSMNSTNYSLDLSTSVGQITIPQLGGCFTLNGRDSKIHVTDYDVGGITLLYSSAEIFTWAKGPQHARILVLYGGENESHEAAFPVSLGTPETTQGSGVTIAKKGSTWVLHWAVTPERKVVKIGDLTVYLLWRNEAYNFWALEVTAPAPVGNFTSPSKSLIVVNGGYLIRNAAIVENELRLTGDVNVTTTFEVISVPQSGVNTIVFNGDVLKTTTSKGALTAVVDFKPPAFKLPNLSTQPWKYIDSLPEIQTSYDDSAWTVLDHPSTNNPLPLTTPTSLYASDYGYHTGSLIYRGHFTANGKDSFYFLNTTGGDGFGHSVWFDQTFLGSWVGNATLESAPQNYSLPALQKGSSHIITVLIDHMGQDEEAPGTDAIKFPRGIIDYSLGGHPASDLIWKVTGNLGGEQYIDQARGPRNEGAMFAERNGYHLPNPPSANWESSSPVENGIKSAGVGFYTTTFDLDIPQGWDVPMSLVLNQTGTAGNYRVQLFVNGYQFGKYGSLLLTLALISHILGWQLVLLTISPKSTT
jgi:hypothetical protein